MKITTKDLAFNAMIAAIYVALTLASIPISFGRYQFRIAEILILLVFFKKNYTLGICVGTAIANFGSTLSMWDALFGTIASLLACICIMFSKHLLTCCLYPVVFNGVIIGLMIYGLSGFGPFIKFLLPAIDVAVGELLVMAVGYILFMVLKRRQDFGKIINGNQNLGFKW